MSAERKSREVAEFGDFQTPPELAQQICALLWRQGIRPTSLLEPTCGIGNFLFAALDHFPSATQAVGLELSPAHTQRLKLALEGHPDQDKVKIIEGNFFDAHWPSLLRDLPELLVIGNPPWVTNAQLSILESTNLPRKSNFLNLRGMDARTGKSNFDISEWMIIQLLSNLAGRNATLAMLCKTTTARKILSYAWKQRWNLSAADLYRIDTPTHFQASVDAGLLICHLGSGEIGQHCSVYSSLTGSEPVQEWAYADGTMIADVVRYERWKHLQGREGMRWRSGIKHDCAGVMELVQDGQLFCNGLGELVDIEPTYLYPMMKATQVANGVAGKSQRYMLIPQRTLGEDTSQLAYTAPKTWQYLCHHSALLEARASSIYRKQPRFAIFGVGDYAFSPWKVAISALHKKLRFSVVGSVEGQPIVLDDTSNFLACQSYEEAERIASLLNSPTAQDFFQAFIFWDAKRPITIDLLQRLNLAALAEESGVGLSQMQDGLHPKQLTFTLES